MANDIAKSFLGAFAPAASAQSVAAIARAIWQRDAAPAGDAAAALSVLRGDRQRSSIELPSRTLTFENVLDSPPSPFFGRL